MEKLRKIQTDEQITWIEALPRVIDMIHDIPGESGLSPYEIMFGRQRPLANIPFPPTRRCDDASEFFRKQEEVDQKVARTLEEIHTKAVERYNAFKPLPVRYQPGDKVWYRRPEKSGTN